MTTFRRMLPIGAALVLVLAACGGSDSESSETTADTTPATVPESAPEVFTPADTSATTDTATSDSLAEVAETDDAAGGETAVSSAVLDEPDGEVQPAGGDAVEATLAEWEIDAPTEYAAGEITFTATNNGNFPHEFVVIRGDSYASLPQEEGGKVLEEELAPDALLGRTDRVGGGESADLIVELDAGNYVLLCNLGDGTNSHAGQGQVLEITVS